jgi:hypothetical protein
MKRNAEDNKPTVSYFAFYFSFASHAIASWTFMKCSKTPVRWQSAAAEWPSENLIIPFHLSLALLPQSWAEEVVDKGVRGETDSTGPLSGIRENSMRTR